MKKIHGFTLIELLVIIITLALIAGLLLPALSRAREEARKTSCKGNLKCFGLLCKMYAQDYSGFWPYEETKGNNARQNYYLLFTSNIADNNRLFNCASSDSRENYDFGDGRKPDDFEYTDYAYVDGPAEAYEDPNLALTVVSGDAWAGHSDPSDNKWTHDNGTNTLWGDGHVEWVTGKYVGLHGPYTDVK